MSIDPKQPCGYKELNIPQLKIKTKYPTTKKYGKGI